MKPLPTYKREPLAQTLLAFQAAQDAQPGGMPTFDVVIVGSGYGGSVAAYRLAGCLTTDAGAAQPRPLRVLLLERGREFRPEDFPSKFGELPRELRVGQQTSGQVQGHSGLFDLRLGDDVNVLLANGLGGGSLINAGVMLEPRPAELADTGFAAQVQQLIQDGHYARARRWLGASVRRQGQWQANDIRRAGALPLKVRAMAELAEPAAPSLPPLTVALDAGENFAGQALPPCVHCGDCMTGCPKGAKDSLDRNLLWLAQARGAVLVTHATVTSLERLRPRQAGARGLWALRVAHTDPGLQLRQNALIKISARYVILAAGALGSTEILLRSRENDVTFSPRLGQRFSCNGDNIGAVQGLQAPANGAADEDVKHEDRQVGPTITTCLPLLGLSQRKEASPRPFWLQEFSVPGALKRLFEEVVSTARVIQQLPQGDRSAHEGTQPDPMAVCARAMGRSLLVGTIGHDSAGGALQLSQLRRGDSYVPTMGALRIHWPEARDGADLDDAQRAIEELVAQRPGRTVVANPMWRLLPQGLEGLVTQPRGPVLTVHPLGGCPVGADAEHGVVDRHGVVFNAGPAEHAPGQSDDWQGSLRVLDGAIVPCSLGANPALTITALASAAIDEMRHRNGWLDTQPPREGDALQPSTAEAPAPLPLPPAPLREPPQAPEPPRRTALRITERLLGPVKLQGRGGGEFQMVLTLHFAERPVAELMAPQRRPVPLDAERSRLRLYPKAQWDEHHLRALDDQAREPYLVFECRLEGSLRFLHRGATTRWPRTVKAGMAYLRNRGLRDIWQAKFAAPDPRAARPARQQPPASLRRLVCDGLKLASRAGEQRRFDYRLTLGALISDKAELAAHLPPGSALAGHKCITYECRANPWRQLTQLQLTAMPAAVLNPAPVLALDTRFIAQQAAPLLAISHQRHQAEALAELLSFALYLFRVLLSTHLWTFRKPDAWRVEERERAPQRLPDVIAGLPDPDITELTVDTWPAGSPRAGQPLKIRLTRYARAPSAAKPPLVFIHGYSVSGNTFTHASLGSTSAAAWFWHRGRDIWVLDLRTSAGLESATWPWAMEDAGMIDLPAALLHVRSTTGFKPDVFAHCIGCVMLSMALLGDADAVRKGTQQLGVNTWLSNEQLGVLAAFNGPAPRSRPGHPTVGRIILSQKGPLLRYTDDNVLRAALMQYLRRWLLGGDYQFRASADPGVAEQLLDRLLSSLPYPAADYDIENPLRPCARTPWVGTRHRMDALYGRDFDAANMEPAVLNAIDDLFGPINLDTVAQTIHFALHDSVCNQRGRGEFVTQNRLRECWAGIPTFSMSGAHNGLADPYTQQLLKAHLGSAGVQHEHWVVPGQGHQDVLIGRRRTIVFERVEEFFRTTQPGGAPQLPAWQASEPWIGPRLVAPGQARRARETVLVQDPRAPGVAVMSRPDRGNCQLVLVPVREVAVTPAHPSGWALADLADAPWPASPPGPSDTWLHATPPLAPEVNWLALLVYEPGEVPLVQAGRARRGAESPHDTPSAVAAWLAAGSPEAAARALVRREALLNMQRLYQRGGDAVGLRLALGSCQYPHGLFDKEPAGAALRACANAAGVDLALWVGDQIYADATAGLMDPTRSDELYLVPHERALRLPAMRQVMQRMPTHMLLDDHEIFDNWERLPPDPAPPDGESGRRSGWQGHLSSPAARQRRTELADARKDALRAFMKFQRMHADRPAPHNADSHFICGGHAFLMLDTRTERRRGEPTSPPEAGRLLSRTQRAALQVWLLRHRDRVKFIATPSALLPRRKLSAEHAANAAMSDAWCGFPGEMYTLFDFMLREQIGKTVFLSGDEHHAFVATARVWRDGSAPLQLISVHSSALYAPFPFANGRPHELCGDEDFVLPGPAGPLHVAVHTEHPCQPGDGLALLSLDLPRAGAAPATPQLAVDFMNTSGRVHDRWQGSVC